MVVGVPEGGEHNQRFNVGEKEPGIGVPFLVRTPGTGNVTHYFVLSKGGTDRLPHGMKCRLPLSLLSTLAPRVSTVHSASPTRGGLPHAVGWLQTLAN